jgi:hypothetical protein
MEPVTGIYRILPLPPPRVSWIVVWDFSLYKLPLIYETAQMNYRGRVLVRLVVLPLLGYDRNC